MNEHSSSRFTDPNIAIEDVRRVPRETAAESGFAANTLLALYREYRVTPLRRKEALPHRLETSEAVRLQTTPIPMATAPQTPRRGPRSARHDTPADPAAPQDQPGFPEA